MNRLVLASRSASRATILAQAGVSFTIADSGLDEAPVKAAALDRGAGARDVAEILAERKAVEVSRSRPNLVLGADQTLELEGRVCDKVATMAEARDRLRLLRGRKHELHSAVAFARRGHLVWQTVRRASLIMRSFSEAFLDDYLARHGEAALGSSGCYLLEGAGAQLFDEIDGDYFTILGLPLLPVLGVLRSEGLVAT